MSDAPVYLDHNATTPVAPEVAEAMLPWLTTRFGNPSSPHALGRAARDAVEEARALVAGFTGAEPGGVVFTSGGTEADNHAITGAVRAAGRARPHVVTSAVEHPAVSATCRALAREGVRTTWLPVDDQGRVDAEAAAGALTDDTVLVTVMHANNEVGTLQPVAAIAARARARGVLVHTDAAQSLGKVPATLDGLGVDMMTLAGHKLYAPKGVGALVLRRGVVLPPLLHGAGHEQGRRPGTENVAGIVGLGVACRLAAAGLAAETARQAALRDRLAAGLLAARPDARVHAAAAARLPNTLSIAFPGLRSPDLLAALPGLALSAGAACHGEGEVGSHVLAAMGVTPDVARGTLRFSLGRGTTQRDIDRAVSDVAAALAAG